MTYALVMIVKNEEDKIEKCLLSAKKYCDKAFIVDTGSTDNTIQICESIFPGSVTTMEWVNFGVNRSVAIERAFGSADWLLTLDADMTVEIDDDFEPNASVDAYQIRMNVNNEREWWLPLLVRGDLPWKYQGALHEYKYLPDRKAVSLRTDKVRVKFTMFATIEKIEERAAVLEKEIETDPENSRNTFYLAYTYLDLGRIEEARELFKKRAEMIGDDEEGWYSVFMAALLEEEWKDQLYGLMQAWHIRPHRPEPIYAMVQGFNARGEFYAAYALAPSKFMANNDICYLHPFIEDWGMKFERSVAAFHVGNVQKAKELSHELLENANLPNGLREKILENLSYCEPEITQ